MSSKFIVLSSKLIDCQIQYTLKNVFFRKNKSEKWKILKKYCFISAWRMKIFKNWGLFNSPGLGPVPAELEKKIPGPGTGLKFQSGSGSGSGKKNESGETLLKWLLDWIAKDSFISFVKKFKITYVVCFSLLICVLFTICNL